MDTATWGVLCFIGGTMFGALLLGVIQWVMHTHKHAEDDGDAV